MQDASMCSNLRWRILRLCMCTRAQKNAVAKCYHSNIPSSLTSLLSLMMATITALALASTAPVIM
jgi:hypothetical protein